MFKYLLESFYLKDYFKNHLLLKNKILNEINIQKTGNLINYNNYYKDNINRLDWDLARNFERPWVKILIKDLINFFNNKFLELGYDGVEILDLWFQQYNKNGTHGWHTHGSTFTGVYYLELYNDSPKTELVFPFNQNKIIFLDVKEGDISIFPSYVIHRSSPNLSNKTKTIISFNLQIEKPTKNILNKIDNLKKI